MAVKLLDTAKIIELRSQHLTYPQNDQPDAGAPAGYGYFSRTRLLPDRTDFTEAGHALMTWQVQARSGLRIRASSLQVQIDAVIIMELGVGPVALGIPCRVVRVVDEPDRQGFSYGSLPGHPESGEESFLLQRTADGVTSLTVAAFSRPDTTLARWGGPLTRGVQRFMTSRYLRALG